MINQFNGITPDSTLSEAIDVLQELEKFTVKAVEITNLDGDGIQIDLMDPLRVYDIFEEKLLASLQEYIDVNIKEAKKCVKKHLDEIGDLD